jgi:isocitrate dehydrogenase
MPVPHSAHLSPPTTSSAISRKDGTLVVPDDPIIPFIEGDGTGPDIWRAAVRVFDAAVAKAYGGARRIVWFQVPAGEQAHATCGEWLPAGTLEAVKAYKVAIKGPLTTPVGGGIRSLNVTLRQVLDLYACVRPVRYYAGTPAPVRHPERMNVIIFRESTEDLAVRRRDHRQHVGAGPAGGARPGAAAPGRLRLPGRRAVPAPRSPRGGTVPHQPQRGAQS